MEFCWGDGGGSARKCSGALLTRSIDLAGKGSRLRLASVAGRLSVLSTMQSVQGL